MRYLGLALQRVLERCPWGRSVVEHIKRHPAVYDNVEWLLSTLIMVLLIRAFVVQAFKIPSGSMIPTLQIGDRLLVVKFRYWLRKPEIGDIIVFRTPDSIYSKDKPIYIKRVVGLPGDTVAIRDGDLYVNGKKVTEGTIGSIKYVNHFVGMKEPFYEKEVPDGHVFVFGDNSRHSYDSRCWGGVPLKYIKGKALLRYWPWFPWRVGLVR